MPNTIQADDPVAEVQALLIQQDTRFTKIENELKTAREKNSRPPVHIGPAGGGALETADAPAHPSQERSFRDWLGTPRGQRSTTSFSTPFKLERRAASPILNAGGVTHYNAIYAPTQVALRLLELIPSIPLTQGASVEYGEETSYTPNADVVAEGQLKPQTVVTYQNAVAAIRTIATWVKASVQSLADVPALQFWLDSRVADAVMLKAESIFLTDLLAAAGALTPDFTPSGGGTTQLDLVGSAIGQLQAAGYTVDGIVLSGSDANKTRLLKTGQGEYLWADPGAAVGMSGMWGIPVVISPAMPAGQFLVGAFGQATILFTRQSLTIEISFENEDDFIRNLCTIRAEERAALAIPIPSALVKGTFGGSTQAAPPTAPRK